MNSDDSRERLGLDDAGIEQALDESGLVESISGRSEAPSPIAHNTVLNLIGLGVPLALAFFVMPVALHALGAARFGLLGLAWAATEYLVLFDLGMGRATVRFVAEAFGRREPEIGRIVASSVITQTATGILGAIVFALLTPWVVAHVFSVPPAEKAEAISMFRIVALNLPVVLLLSTLRGALEGIQRFDLSNGIKMATGAAAVIIPAVAARAGLGLPAIMTFILLSRLTGCLAMEYALRRAVPNFRWGMPEGWQQIRKMIFFGGWVSASSVLTPILLYLDRFSLAAITGLAAVGYYTAPYEGVSRLLLIPVSLIGTLFPALTTEEARGNRARAGSLLSAANRHLILAMTPPVAIIIALSPLVLRIWLGPAAAETSGTAMRILAAGVFINALAHPSFVFLYALGRPDLPAKFHLAELCVHVPLTWFLVSSFGVAGAATAWAIRVSIDCLLLNVFSRRFLEAAPELESRRLRPALVLSAALFGMAMLAGSLVRSAPISAIILTGAALVAYLFFAWTRALDATERELARSMGRWYLRGARRAA